MPAVGELRSLGDRGSTTYIIKINKYEKSKCKNKIYLKPADKF